MASTANTPQTLPTLDITPKQPIIRHHLKRTNIDSSDASPLKEKPSSLKPSVPSNSTSHPILTRLSPTGRDSRRSNKSPTQRFSPVVGVSKVIRVNLIPNQSKELSLEKIISSPEQKPLTTVSFDIKEIKEESEVKDEANTLLSIIKEVTSANEKQIPSVSALRESREVKLKEVQEINEHEHKEHKKHKEHKGEHKTHTNYIIHILKKDYEDRSEEDLERLAVLVSDIAFFKNLEITRGRARLLKCLARLTYSKAKTGTKVFSQGEPGTTYHIILRGTVKVSKASWVKAEQEVMPGDHIKETLEVKPETKTLNKSNSSINGEQEEEAPVIRRPKKKNTTIDPANTRTTAGVTQVLVSSDIGELYAGETFGEVALLTNKPRGATVTALEDCDFAVLEKLDFDRILSEYEEKLLEEKLSFLNSMKVFQGWNYTLITRLYYHLRHQKYHFNNVLYREGTKANRVFIVRKGELTVYRRTKVQETEKIHKMHMLSKRPVYKDLAIAVIGPREMLGEEDILTSGAYTHTVICTSSEAEIMSISRKDFINHVWSDEGSKYYLKSYIKVKLQNFEERAKEVQASWADKKGLLYSSSPNSIAAPQLIRKPSGVTDIYNRLEQFYQTPIPAQDIDSNDQSDFEIQTRLQLPNQTVDTPPILEFLEGRKASQSPHQGRTMSQPRDPVLVPGLSVQLKSRQQTINLSPAVSPQKEKSLGLEKNGSIPKRGGAFPFPSTEHSPINNNNNYSPAGFAEMLSPIRSPNRSFVLSDGPKDSPSFLRHQKDNDLSPEDEKFSLEGGAKSKDGSGANTMRMIGLNVNPNPIQVYKKNTYVLEENGGQEDLSDRMNQLARAGSLVRLPLKTFIRMDSDRTKSIPRIRVEARTTQGAGLTQSQLFDKRQFDSTPGVQPVNNTIGDVASPVRLVHNESYRPIQTEPDGSLEEKRRNVHPKVKMLGSLRTRLRVGIIKYQGLQKHLDSPDEMERENISRNMIMKQIDENKQSMRLVFGTKLFTDIRKDITRKFYENKKRKEQVMPPNLINEAMRDYLRSIATEQGATGTSKAAEQEGNAQTEPVNLEDFKKDPKKFSTFTLKPVRSISEPPAQKKKPARAQSSFLNRQLNFAQEVEQETQKMYKKIYGKLVTKRLLDNVESPNV